MKQSAFWSWLCVTVLLHSTVAQQHVFQGNTPRIVAMGDLHGDLNNTLLTMRFSGLIDEEGHWAGNDTIFVQTGDVVDRGVDTIELYRLLQRLRVEAPLYGGQVVSLLGNHEIMNMIGDWRYVHPADTASFGGKEKRQEAFSPSGWIGQELVQLNLTAKVGNSVFCHGGIHPAFAHGGVETLNQETQRWLIPFIETRGHHDSDPYGLFGGHGPTWYRGYALDDEKNVCQVLQEALNMLQADRMVMGHTVQRNGQIQTRCQGKAVLIDIGLSRVYGGHPGALEIVGDTLTAIYKDRRVPLHKKDKSRVHEEL